MIYLRSIIFYILFIISIPITAILMRSIPLIFKNISPWDVCKHWDRYVNMLLLNIGKIKIEVIGDYKSINEPALIIANHTGPWETVGIKPLIPKDFTFVVKRDLLTWKYIFFAFGLKALDPIGISRESNAGDFSIMKEASLKHFEHNRDVLLFPGGTRKALKESLDYGLGGVLLAKKLKCNLQVIYIDSECWARGKYIKDYGVLNPGIIKFHYGPLITKEQIKELKAKEIYKIIQEFNQNCYNKK